MDEWLPLAACQGQNVDLWFPKTGESARVAKRICFECPVRSDCLAHALKHEPVGVWGGFTDAERRRIKRRQRRKPSASVKSSPLLSRILHDQERRIHA